LDALLGLNALLIAKKRSVRYRGQKKWSSSDSALFGDHPAEPLSDTDELYPFRKIFSRENPLQLCALIVGIILSAEKILFRLLFDLSYGAPESFAEVMIMVVYYASDILIGIIYYCISVLVYHQLLRPKKQKKKSRKQLLK